MRIRPQVTRDQRLELKAALARLQRPEVALGIARECLNGGFEPATVECTLQSVHPDRFVTCVRVASEAGEKRGFALKVYADDFGEQMWALASRLREHALSSANRVFLPFQYLKHSRALVFPWVDGTRLSEIVD